MWRDRLRSPVVLIALVAACTSTPTATMGPTPAKSTGSFAPTIAPTLPTVVLTPTASVQSPTASGAPSWLSTPSPEATPTFAPDTSIWHPLLDFPPPNADVRDVEADRYDFVVGGSVVRTDGCPDAHIWTSLPDGDWLDAINGATHDATVAALTKPYGWPAFGYSGPAGCGAGEVTAYMPSDKADWYQPTVSGFLPGDEVLDAVQLSSFDGVIASGAFADDVSHAGVWLGHIALRGAFHRSRQPPATLGELSGLGVMGATVFGFDSTADRPAWYSEDSGETWQASPFGPDFWFVNGDSVTFEGAEYVGGSACCTSPGVSAGMIVSSSDGIGWQPATPLGLAAPIADMAAMPAGLIAVSSSRDVYLSADGSEWRQGPRLPLSVADEHLFVAATESQVLVISHSDAWLAAVANLDPRLWPTRAPAAETPVVGDAYPRYALSTACGPGPMRFDLRTWMPDPATLVDGNWPPRFDPNLERGKLTFAARDRLEFVGEHGATVNFMPSPPTEGAPCA